MATSGRWRVAAVAAQAAALTMALACESGSPVGTLPPQRTPTATPTTPISWGAVGGTVTINGEARPIVWVELRAGAWASAYGSTIPDGSWEWDMVPVGIYDVVIKTPEGLRCDATSKAAIVAKDQRTVVNFACVGEVKGSIQGFAAHEFGTAAFTRVTAAGPVDRETISNENGFFAFDDLPPGEYVVGRCNPVRVTVRDGATAFAIQACG